jgi:hypothetical protein
MSVLTETGLGGMRVGKIGALLSKFICWLCNDVQVTSTKYCSVNIDSCLTTTTSSQQWLNPSPIFRRQKTNTHPLGLLTLLLPQEQVHRDTQGHMHPITSSPPTTMLHHHPRQHTPGMHLSIMQT